MNIDEIKKRARIALGMEEKPEETKVELGELIRVHKYSMIVDQDSFAKGDKITESYENYEGETVTNPLSDGEYFLENGDSIQVDSDGVIVLYTKKATTEEVEEETTEETETTEEVAEEEETVEASETEVALANDVNALAERIEALELEKQALVEENAKLAAEPAQTPASERTEHVQESNVDDSINDQQRGLITIIKNSKK